MLTYAISPSGASGLRRLTALAALTALALPCGPARAQSGLPAWIEPPEGSVRFGQAVASGADVDGDGVHDIYVADPGYTTIVGQVGRWFVYSGATRAMIWSVVGEDLMEPWPLEEQYRFPGAFIDDFDSDGLPDLLVGRSTALDARGVVEVYRGLTGERLLRTVGEDRNWVVGKDVSRLGDLDGDNVDEFCYVRSGWVHFCSGATGEVVDSLQLQAARRVRSAGDVDGDGVADIAIGLYLGDLPSGIHLYSGRTRQLLWGIGRPSSVDRLFGYNLAAGHDLDGDSIPDILATAGESGRQRFCVVSGATGQVQVTDWPGVSNFLWVSLADLNGDGRVEPIVGTARDRTNLPRYTMVFDHTPAPVRVENLAYTIDRVDLRGGVFGDEMAAADVTGDGCAEILLGTTDNTGVHIIGGSPMLFGHDNDTYAAFGEREVRRGFTHRFAAVGNAVGRPVRLAVSRRGNGCTFIPQLGICLDLDRPFQQIAQAITDADGFARFSIPIPANTSLGPVWMQCLDVNFPRRGPSTSNVMKIEIVE